MGKHRKPYDDHHETDVLAEIVEETPDLNALKTSQYQPLYDPHGTSPLPRHQEPEPWKDPFEYEAQQPKRRMSPTIVSGIALTVIVVAIVLAIVIISTNGAPLCR